jgi:hypothetical protein
MYILCFDRNQDEKNNTMAEAERLLRASRARQPHRDGLGWEFRFRIPISGMAGIRNSVSGFGIPELSGGK